MALQPELMRRVCLDRPSEANRLVELRSSLSNQRRVYVEAVRSHAMAGVRIELSPYDPGWPARYEREASQIRRGLGDRVRLIAHVGSTSVPGLAAKPIIDIVLAVKDSADESSYAPAILNLGYHLRIREPDWYEHRVFRGPSDDVNLHVFTEGAYEIERMIRFRDRLRSDDADRLRYEEKKRELSGLSWNSVQDYADAKSDLIESILAST